MAVGKDGSQPFGKTHITSPLQKTRKVSGDVALNPIAREGHCQQSQEALLFESSVFAPAFPCVVAKKTTLQTGSSVPPFRIAGYSSNLFESCAKRLVDIIAVGFS
jgi:hypothetical protein